jgi:hypothetical protein
VNPPKPRHLFKTESGTGNVVLNFTGAPTQELAVIGTAYHEAGQSLVAVFNKKRGYSDVEAYPIVFLYRHSLELLFKAIITIGNDLAHLLEDPTCTTDDPYRDHSLAKHLPKIKQIFEAVGWADAFEQAGFTKTGFENVVKEFDGLDPGSFTFRYPMKKDGSAALEKSFIFSVREFADVLDPILRTLAGGCSGLEEYRSQLGEARASIREDAFNDYCADYSDEDDYGDMYSDYDRE